MEIKVLSIAQSRESMHRLNNPLLQHAAARAVKEALFISDKPLSGKQGELKLKSPLRTQILSSSSVTLCKTSSLQV
jgi:hypothetical protein